MPQRTSWSVRQRSQGSLDIVRIVLKRTRRSGREILPKYPYLNYVGIGKQIQDVEDIDQRLRVC